MKTERAIKSREPERRALVPITILTGFLGAGKTTLLNRILSTDHGLRVAVLVNDFGAINIDAKLVVSVEGETIGLSNGCVCCTIRDDLLTEVMRLLEHPERPDYIIIEASGVSDPKMIVSSFLDSEICAHAQVDGIVTIVDAEQLPNLRGDTLELALDQIFVADIVVLNKSDLVSDKELDAVRARISELVPGTRQLTAVQANVPLALVLGIGSFNADRIHELETGHYHDHGAGEHDCDHSICDHVDHSASFSTWSWRADQPLSLATFRSVIAALPDTIYRAKGILQLQEYPRYRVEFQLTGRRSSLSATGLWDDIPQQSEVVMIGVGDNVQFEPLNASLDACLNKTGDSPFIDWRKNPRSI